MKLPLPLTGAVLQGTCGFTSDIIHCYHLHITIERNPTATVCGPRKVTHCWNYKCDMQFWKCPFINYWGNLGNTLPVILHPAKAISCGKGW